MTPAFQARPTPRTLLALGGLLVAMLLASLDQSVAATALPAITTDLGRLDLFSWVTTAYVLAASITTPLYGKLGDLYGRRPLFSLALLAFLSGSALCGLATSMPALIAFRVLQGVGGGGLIVSAGTIFAELFAPEQRARYQGWFTAVFAAASVVGPLLGGIITDTLGWRWAFYLNLPLGLAALGIGLFVLRLPSPTRRPSIDVLGMVLLAGVITCTVLLSNWGGTTYPWTSPAILSLALGAVLLLLAWLRVERRAPEPVIPLRLFGSRVLNLSNAVTFLSGFALFGGVFFIPLFLQFVSGESATQAGLLLLPLTVGLLLVSLTGPLIEKLGQLKWLGVAGMASSTLGAALLTALVPETPRTLITFALVLLGVGLGLVMQIYTLTVLNTLPPSDLGTGMSTSIFARQVGGSLGLAVFGSIFSGRLASELAARLPPGVLDALPSQETLTPVVVARLAPDVSHQVLTGYATAISMVFLVATAALGVGLLLALLLPPVSVRPRPPQSQDA